VIVDNIRTQFVELAHAPGPLLIASDLDGTLAPIVDRPQDARVPQAVLDLLRRLAKRCRIAVVTGRDLNTARKMVPVEDVIIIGSHGLEASIENQLLPTFDRTQLAASLERVEKRVITDVPSIYKHVERKAISTAFHYRDIPDVAGALESSLRNLPDNLALRRGKMVLEVIPRAKGGKDQAMRALIDHFKPRSVLAMGDDLTDVGMFRVVRKLRDDTGRPALIAGISGGAETPPEISAVADVMLPTADDAREGLAIIAEVLKV
jgi:trehalose-phosphatase